MASVNNPNAEDLLARLEVMERLRLKMLDALDSVAQSGGFSKSPGGFQDPTGVLQDTARRVMNLAPFQATALWLVNEFTSDFELGWCEPGSRREFMIKEFEQLTREGIIALALRDERPVMAAGSSPELRHVVQVLTTPLRVRGLLISHLEEYDHLPDCALSLLHILCQSAAASLEGLELYRLLREKNANLETESKTRREVQARQALFAQAFLNSLEGMLIIDAAGRILEANPAANQLIRHVSDSLVGKNARTILSWIGARRFFKAIIKEMTVRGRFKGEIVGRDAQDDSFHLWLSVNAVRRDHGRMDNYVAVLHSMAGRKELEAALIQAELKYKDIFEHAPVAIFRTTADGRILDVNPACAEILGYASPEEIVHSVRDIASQLYVDSSERDRYVDKLMAQGSVKDYEVRLRRKDGHEIQASMNSRMIRNTAGHVLLINGFMRDVTAVRKAEEEQERLQKQLHQAQKLQSVGRLAGGVAHDFNNMLGVILGQVQLALMKVNSQDPLYSRLLEIEKAAQRSADLVRQLLAFARKQTVVPRILNLNENIANSLKMLGRLTGENIALVWKPCADPWLVKIDPSQVDQIMINLVVNAQDAIAGPGAVTIATDNIVLDDAFCRDQAEIKPGDYFLLTVRDTGCGMDQKTLDQIFEPFFTTKDVGQGTGLGLATVYGIVKQNNGLITVTSATGHGTTFHVHLPRACNAGINARRSGRRLHVQDGKKTILVVEDEAALLNFIRESLLELGHSVLTSDNPWEAVRLVRNHEKQVDLLIADVVMPEMNGTDLAHRLRALKPGLQCICMSRRHQDLITDRGALGKGLHFLQKPFTLNELDEAIRQALA